jgi:hypothetical protein
MLEFIIIKLYKSSALPELSFRNQLRESFFHRLRPFMLVLSVSDDFRSVDLSIFYSVKSNLSF